MEQIAWNLILIASAVYVISMRRVIQYEETLARKEQHP